MALNNPVSSKNANVNSDNTSSIPNVDTVINSPNNILDSQCNDVSWFSISTPLILLQLKYFFAIFTTLVEFIYFLSFP